jgi:DNA-binding MarR family transcriptional regulator
VTDPRAARGLRRPDESVQDGADELGTCVDAVLIASRALLGVVAVSMAPMLEEVTLPQYRALVLLSVLGPTRIGALARRLGVHQSTFTRTTDRMVEAGIVRRLPNPENRREVLVEATDAGLAHVHQVTERRRREIERVVAGLDAAQREVLQVALETFARAAGEPPDESLAVLGG